MNFDITITDNEEQKSLHENLNISDERLKELADIFEAESKDNDNTASILKKLVQESKTLEELVFQCFIMGTIAEGYRRQSMQIDSMMQSLMGNPQAEA